MFTEKPPMMSGDQRRDLLALRDYLFRLSSSLEPIAATGSVSIAPETGGGGGQYVSEAVKEYTGRVIRNNARELQSLIIKSANDVTSYVDRKAEQLSGEYVAKSEYGEFVESIDARIETSARGVVETYNYGAQIDSLQDSIDLAQSYFTRLDGEIRRGIVLDPTTQEYVVGIAISEAMQFSGECGPDDPNNPGDGYTYYYLTEGQTFGLYTSTGWQFWIDGIKRGWFDSVSNMLHVYIIYAESAIVLTGFWQITSSADGSEFEIAYIG